VSRSRASYMNMLCSHFWTHESESDIRKGPLRGRPQTADQYLHYVTSGTRLNGEALGAVKRRGPSPLLMRHADGGKNSEWQGFALSKNVSLDAPQRRLRSQSPLPVGRFATDARPSIDIMLETGRRARKQTPTRPGTLSLVLSGNNEMSVTVPGAMSVTRNDSTDSRSIFSLLQPEAHHGSLATRGEEGQPQTRGRSPSRAHFPALPSNVQNGTSEGYDTHSFSTKRHFRGNDTSRLIG